MNGLAIDHLVVAARTIEEGAEYVARVTGSAVETGGRHESMGTHNVLMRLGDSCYLEVIAVDPDAPAPKRPRLFGLDTPAVRERLESGPFLVTWAVRTAGIAAAAARSSVTLGEITPMSRGDLRWRLTLTADGTLPEGGLVPFLIQWETTPHPATAMRESGCSLLELEALHAEPERLEAHLRALGVTHLVTIRRRTAGSKPSLEAILQTPRGRVTLA